ncbi:MAG TPA: hypothetical protein VJS13_01310 [Pyrinomonadaceae bacterium]|nr:hypothetical protein [Pyrinomonadaceae bacterium]
MTKLTCLLSSLSIFLPLILAAQPGEQTASTQHDVISRASVEYYSLARKGFKGFTATIEPNWEVILAQTATPANLKIFRDVRFTMVVDANGAITVTHELGPNASKPDLQPTVNRIHSDVQRLLTGFFSTWRLFVVGSPFPANEIQVKLEKSRNQYRLSYTTQAGDVTITTTGDLLIKEWNLSGPTLRRAVKPQFQKTLDGYLLTGYHGNFEPVGDGIKTTLDFKIEYQDFNGMKVPQKVRFNGMHGSEPVEAELVFVLKS